MARAISVDETIPCPSIRSGEAADRLVAVARSEYQTVSASADRIHFARTRRPTWALVTGIALIPVIVGIPILLIKRTETWVAAIEEDHRNVQVHVTGSVIAAVMIQLHEVLAEGPTPVAPNRAGVIETVSAGSLASDAPSTTSTASTPSVMIGRIPPPPSQDTHLWMPPGPGDGSSESDGPASSDPFALAPERGRDPSLASDDLLSLAEQGVTVARFRATSGLTSNRPSAISQAPVSSPSSDTIGALMVVFDTGERIDLGRGESAFIGRDPAVIGDYDGARLTPIDDPTSSISKTHLRITRRADGVEVVDLGSTNGTMVCAEPGSPQEAALPDMPVLVYSGGVVRFGEREMMVRPARNGSSA